MSQRIGFIIGLLLAMFISTTSANAEDHTTKVLGAVGVVGSVGGLGEVGLGYEVNDWLNLTSSVGVFNTSPYADAGFSLAYDRVTVGISGAYVFNVPKERLTGHFQFKPRFGVAMTDRLSLVYTHFSNGNGIFGDGEQVNRGVDFLGVQVKF